MESTELIELEQKDKRKLPAEIKEKIRKSIFRSLVSAMILMVYIFVINLTYNKSDMFKDLVKYYACFMSFISMLFLEIAYNKNSKFCLTISIEILVSCILSVYIPYIYMHMTSKFRTVIVYLPAIIVVYYFIKSFVIFKREKKAYLNTLSDIKEILEDDKKEYLDEKSGKLYRKKLKEEEKIKAEIKVEQEVRKKKKLSLKKEKR